MGAKYFLTSGPKANVNEKFSRNTHGFDPGHMFRRVPLTGKCGKVITAGYGGYPATQY